VFVRLCVSAHVCVRAYTRKNIEYEYVPVRMRA